MVGVTKLYVNKGNTYPDYLPATDDELLAAAATLDGAEPLWRCEVHQAPCGDRIIDTASRCSLSLEEGSWAYDCHMVEGLWFPLPDKEATDG